MLLDLHSGIIRYAFHSLQIPPHIWKHNSFPLDAQKFVFLMGVSAKLAQDREVTPQQDVATLLEKFRSLVNSKGLDKLPSPTPPNKVSSIFLTGATGLTGSQLLINLLEHLQPQTPPGEVMVFCLVRARDSQHAFSRIVEGITGRGLCWKQKWVRNVIPVVGDLEAPRLGMSSRLFSALASRVDSVYHAARVVDFTQPYSSLRKSNVMCLEALIEFCTTTRQKHFHVISDFAAHLQYFGAFAKDLCQEIRESFSISQQMLDRLESQMPAGIVGYPWCRWACETVCAGLQDLLRSWLNRCPCQETRSLFGVTLYRLPNSAVYFSNGRLEFSNPFFVMASAAFKQKALPPGVLPVGPPFLSTPIDTATELVVELSRKTTEFSIFNVVNRVGITRKEFARTLCMANLNFLDCTTDEFLRGVEKDQEHVAAHGMLPLMRVSRSVSIR